MGTWGFTLFYDFDDAPRASYRLIIHVCTTFCDVVRAFWSSSASIERGYGWHPGRRAAKNVIGCVEHPSIVLIGYWWHLGPTASTERKRVCGVPLYFAVATRGILELWLQ